MSSHTLSLIFGNSAFQDCTSLATVAMPPVLSGWASNSFDTSGMIFLVPDNSTYVTWAPPVGTKIVTIDGSITPTGSAAIPVGDTVSLSCTEIVGASYQWQKETSPGVWTAITGATNATYSNSNAALADSGNYRARITFGTITPFHTASISLTVTAGANYTVTFDSQGGSAVATITAIPGSTITAPAIPTRLGYAFAWWYKEAACVNAWDFSTDTVTSDITLYAKWTEGSLAPGAVDSIGIGTFPLTLAPGGSFEARLTYAAAGGAAPDPVPVLSVQLDSASAALVSVEILSQSSARVTALPISASITRSAPLNSAIYGETRIEFVTSQTLADGSTFRQSAVKALVIADDLATSIDVTDEVIEEFNDANDQLAASDETILPGNTQPPITSLRADWFLLEGIDNTLIDIINPDAYVLPECFEPAGRDAANIDINVSHLVPPDMKALLPLTFRVTARRGDLENIFGGPLAGQMLASPLDHLDEIFTKMVIQKEIMEGERAGWYTRLVSGVLKPQEAVDKGILEVAGGEALTLTLTLSYYVLDDALMEAFESSGYLIVPDGLHDGEIVAPIWLNMWKPGYVPGDNTLQGQSAGTGGGCASGTAPILLLAVSACAVILIAKNRESAR
jgi:uncharacterized repeat protein (TIGR02543 family)